MGGMEGENNIAATMWVQNVAAIVCRMSEEGGLTFQGDDLLKWIGGVED